VEAKTYLDLRLDGLREAARPFQARVLLDDLLDHVLVHEVCLPAHVVCISRLVDEPRTSDGRTITTTQLTKLSSNLHQLPHPRNRARLPRILMPNNRLTNTFRLRPRRPEPLQLLQRHKTPVPLETHMRLAAVLVRRSKIVVQASQGPGFEKVALGSGDPGGEVLGDERVAVAVDAEAVVVGLGREEGADVGLGFLDDAGLWPDGVEGDGDGGCFGGGGGGHV
jgi:hypothetical protein